MRSAFTPFYLHTVTMAPPLYGDLGKSARDVFGKGFHFGTMKLDVKTKTNTGVEFASGAVSNTDTGKFSGNLETKYKFKDYGVTFTEKWTTDNALCTKLEAVDQLGLKGIKLTLDTSFSPQTGAKSAVVKSEYKHDAVSLTADVDLNLAAGGSSGSGSSSSGSGLLGGGPIVNATAVIGHKGWLAGYELAYDTSKSRLTRNNFGVGYAAADFVVHTNVNNGEIFGGSVFHRVNSSLETGVNVGWTASNNATNFGIGCKYDLDKVRFGIKYAIEVWASKHHSRFSAPPSVPRSTTPASWV